MLLVRESVTNDPREVAEMMALAWPVQAEDGRVLRMNRGGARVAIDLGTRQGRFELAALAILCAAKVREATAFETFNALSGAGLLDVDAIGAIAVDAADATDEADVVDGADPEHLAAIEEVLLTHYRALAHKRQKAAAILTAARKIVTEYGGDLANAGNEGDWRGTLAALEGFPHIKSRAAWVCREFRRHGVWPELHPRACAAIDSSVKLALWRTGFVGDSALFLREIPARDCLVAVDRFFDGNSLPAFYQGERLCRKNAVEACASACKLRGVCRSPQIERRKTPEQRPNNRSVVHKRLWIMWITWGNSGLIRGFAEAGCEKEFG